MKFALSWFSSLFLLLLPLTSLAVDSVRVKALFPDKAMVEIDGTTRVLKVGKTSPEGVTLISADSREAVIELNGERKSYSLDNQIGGTLTAPKKAEVRIPRGVHGDYSTVGSIDGRTVNFLVDTGASSIAMSEVEAKRLGIPYWLKGEKAEVQTASGFARAYRVTLDEVRVGEISMRQVQAFVVEGNNPARVLLGMSFLGRLEMENAGNMMVLRTKF
jgi:aspartyl protease family protein